MKRIWIIFLTGILLISSVMNISPVYADENNEKDESDVTEVLEENDSGDSEIQIEEEDPEVNNENPSILDSGTISGNTFTVYSDYSMVVSGNGSLSFGTGTGPITAYYEDIESLTIGNGISYIGNYIFSGFTGLKNLTMPISAEIAQNAFNNTTNIEHITLTVGNGEAYDYSYSDGDYQYTPWYKNPGAIITLSDGIEKIGSYMFAGNTSLTEITIPDTVSLIYEGAFKASGLTSISFPDSVISIGNRCFENCTNLQSVVLPKNLTDLRYYVFSGCTALTDVELNYRLQNIRGYAFNGCTSLSSFYFPENIYEIESYAFNNCTGFNHLELFKSIHNVCEYAFFGCSNVQYVIHDSMANAGWDTRWWSYSYTNDFGDNQYEGLKRQVPKDLTLTLDNNGNLYIETENTHYLSAIMSSPYSNAIQIKLKDAPNSDYGAKFQICRGADSTVPPTLVYADGNPNQLLLTHEMQEYACSYHEGKIVNGLNTVSISTENYYQSSTDLTFTKNAEPAPDDVTMTYCNGVLMVHSEDEDFFDRVVTVRLYYSEDNSSYYSSSLQKTGNNTAVCVFNTGFFEFYDETGSSVILNKDCEIILSVYDNNITNADYLYNRCNVIASVYVDKIPLFKRAEGSGYMKSYENGITIHHDDSNWLNALTQTDNDTNAVSYTLIPADTLDFLEELDEVTGYDSYYFSAIDYSSTIEDESTTNYGCIEFKDASGNRYLVKNTGNETPIVLTDGEIVISDSYLSSKNFPEGKYDVRINVSEYYIIEIKNFIYANDMSESPGDLYIRVDISGNLLIETSSQDYIDSIYSVHIQKNNYSYLSLDEDSFTKTSHLLTIPACENSMDIGSYSILINAVGYTQGYGEFTVEYTGLKEVPSVNVYCNSNGDLVVSSSDPDYLNALAFDDIQGRSGIKGKLSNGEILIRNSCYGYSDYDFETMWYSQSTLIQTGNTVVLSNDLLKAMNVLKNRPYNLTLYAKGYKTIEKTDVYISGGDEAVPDNISTRLSGNYLYIDITGSANYLNAVNYIWVYGQDSETTGSATFLSKDFYKTSSYIRLDISNCNISSYQKYNVYMEADGYIDALIPLNETRYYIYYHYLYGANAPWRYYYNYASSGYLDLETPSRPGYTFDGWYDSNDTRITRIYYYEGKDIHLYAKWSVRSLLIYFNGNGGKGSIEPMYLSGQDSVVLPGSGFTKKGKTINYWIYYDNNGASYWLPANSPFPFDELCSFSNNGVLTLYAGWEPAEYTIYFMLDDYKGNEELGASIYAYKSSGSITLPKLTAPGYDFYWCTRKLNSNGNYVYTKITSIQRNSEKDYVLYGMWIPIGYKISYSTSSGKFTVKNSSDSNYQTSYHADSVALDLPDENDISRTGYTLEGWYAGYNSKTKVYSNKIENLEDLVNLKGYKNVTLYAKWEPITYTVIYKSDEYESDPITVKYDQNYKLDDDILPKPGKKATKYTYTSNGKTVTVSSTSSVKNLVKTEESDPIYITVAKSKGKELWTNIVYTITYNAGEFGKNNSKNVKTYTIDSKPITLYAPSCDHYYFAHWIDADTHRPVSVFTPSETNYGNKTFNASYSDKDFEVHLDTNGGTLPQGYNEYFTYLAHYEVELPIPTRDNYTFMGWYNGKTKLSKIAYGSHTNYNLVAKWTQGTNYTIVYDKNDVNASGKVSSQSVKAGKDISLAANSFKLAGKAFREWNRQPDGSGLSYLTKQKIYKTYPLSSLGNETVTLYAIWDETATFTLYFDANCENATGTMKTQTMSNTSYKALLANAYKRKGYTFIGWNSDPDGTGYFYNNKEVFSRYTSDPNHPGTETLYAMWTLNTYKITYKNIKSSDNNTNPSTYTVEDDDIILTAPSRNGYLFGGWYLDSSYKKAVTDIEPSQAKNITLYAKWIAAGQVKSLNEYRLLVSNCHDYSSSVALLKAQFKGFAYVSFKVVGGVEQDGYIKKITINGSEDYEAKWYPKSSTKIVIEIVKG